MGMRNTHIVQLLTWGATKALISTLFLPVSGAADAGMYWTFPGMRRFTNRWLTPKRRNGLLLVKADNDLRSIAVVSSLLSFYTSGLQDAVQNAVPARVMNEIRSFKSK